jgi:hypothetical protein
MAKYKEPMGVQKAAKTAKEKSENLRRGVAPKESTKRIVRRNTQGGKLSLGDRMFGVHGQSEAEKKASDIVQTRRESESSRTASRAKGIAARQKKVAKARRQKKALGN